MAITSEQLKKVRKELGLTQAELAAALSLTRELISKMESGNLPISKSSQIIIQKFIDTKNVKSENNSHLDDDDIENVLSEDQVNLEGRINFRDKYILLLERTLKEKELLIQELQAKIRKKEKSSRQSA